MFLAYTTLRLDVSTKKDLGSLKNFEKESFEDVIERLINVAKEEPLDADEIRQIESSLEDIKKGNVLSLKQAEKKWGI